MSLATVRAGYIIGFIAGLACIGLAVFLIVYCFTVTMFIGDYNSYYSSINLDNFLESYAGVACIPLMLGAVLIYNTYQFFIPGERENSLPAPKDCPYCGALLKPDATVCEKCNRPIE